jgi:uncharacterized protein (DUF2062 family)
MATWQERWTAARRRATAIQRLVLHTRNTPEQVGLGVAIGVFLGMALPPGVQFIPAIAIAQMSRASVPAAALATFVSNPLTMPILYPLSAALGSWVTGIPLRMRPPESDESFWRLAADPVTHGRILLLIFVGNVIIGSVLSVVGYHAAKRTAEWRRQRKLRKSGQLPKPDGQDPYTPDL